MTVSVASEEKTATGEITGCGTKSGRGTKRRRRQAPTPHTSPPMPLQRMIAD
jgi:hypothetical protein